MHSRRRIRAHRLSRTGAAQDSASILPLTALRSYLAGDTLATNSKPFEPSKKSKVLRGLCQMRKNTLIQIEAD